MIGERPAAGAASLFARARQFLALISRFRLRHARALPLALTVAASELLFRLPFWRRGAGPPAQLDWGVGVSVVIPERGAPAMLGSCLRHLHAAVANLGEPAEVIVVVNGSPLDDYAGLRADYPDVRWLHAAEPMGFTRAVLAGVAEAKHGAIYLLNNDMLLDADALRETLPWRAAHVVAVASQIFLQDSQRRREETGWTSMAVESGLPVPRHETPRGETARGAVWAGAGSALFHAGYLRQRLPDSLPFDPFYWEDVDVCVRAWRQGYEVVFCPRSIAWHKHRATVQRYFPPAEVARIFERNRIQFELRNPFPPQSLKATLGHVARLDRATLCELGSWRRCAALWRARWRAFRAAYRDMDYAVMWAKRHARPLGRPHPRPIVVVVSPFVVLPPRHGGAVRTQRLAVELARDFEVILLSDELDLYGEPHAIDHAPFAAVHLVRGRPDASPRPSAGRIARIETHSHRAFKDELRRILDVYRPVAVLVEHMELAGLVDVAPAARPAFILDLHDVLLCPDDPAQFEADRFELQLIDRFDGVAVSSREDRALLGARPARLVPNGFDRALLVDYAPSRGHRGILFVGPFRVPNNWQGIREFLEQAYPGVEAAVAGVSITIVGGRGALRLAAEHACFARPSVHVLEEVDDLRPLLHACALTINPQPELRGSSLKLIESLAAGRVCVTTRVGARGWLDHDLDGVVAVGRAADFASPLIALLTDDDRRLALEAPRSGQLAPLSWEAAGQDIRALVRAVAQRRQ